MRLAGAGRGGGASDGRLAERRHAVHRAAVPCTAQPHPVRAAVTTALVVCTKLIGPDLINAVYPLVVERLRHPKEAVRKKAVMALHR